MFLAFKLRDLITVPFGWLMGWLYQVTGNYGVAMILFAVCVQMALLPITAKSKRGMMKMSRIQPQMQEIQRRYADDQQKQGEAIRQLQQEEGVSMGGSCLWSLIPLFILFPLFTVIREPLTYILGESAEVTAQIIAVIKENAPQLFESARGNFYDQVTAAGAISHYAAELKAALVAGKDHRIIAFPIGAGIALGDLTLADTAHALQKQHRVFLQKPMDLCDLLLTAYEEGSGLDGSAHHLLAGLIPEGPVGAGEIPDFVPQFQDPLLHGGRHRIQPVDGA